MKHGKSLRGIRFLMLVLVFASSGAWAQTAQINGTVRDASGLAIPGAVVQATQTETHVVRTTTSGADGSYVFPNLPIGPYQIQVTKEGFNKYLQTGIVLQVATNPTVAVTLQVGTVNEQVSVEANAAEVETRTTSIGGVVTNQQVMEMPLNGRDPRELIFLQGMANFPGPNAQNTVRNYPTLSVNIAGAQEFQVGYYLDGSIWQDPYNSGSFPLPNPDAMQEFKVETSATPAQYGWHAGATVNIVTKSGTNEYHGDLFEFLRNADLNSRDFFAAARDNMKRNQFGGVFGGPVLPRFRDKLFFFAGFQRTSLRSYDVQHTAYIPTPAVVGGDFTAMASPACNSGKAVTLPESLGFANNRITPSLLSPWTLAWMKTMPVTPPNDPCGKVLYGLVQNTDEDLWTGKVDYQVSSKNSFFGHFQSGHLTQPPTYDGFDPLSASTAGTNGLNYGGNIGDTYIVSPTLISSFRFGLTRQNLVKSSENYASPATFGSAMTPLAGNVMYLNVTGAFGIGINGDSPGHDHGGPMPSVTEDISWVKGPHQIGFGGSYYHQMLNYESGGYATGKVNFSGQVTGLPLADLMLGDMSTFSQGTSYGYYTRQSYSALYIQDTWKVNSRLTLNYGLRWEPYQGVNAKYGENDHFDEGAFLAGIHSRVYVNAPAGLVFPGDTQYPCPSYFNCSDWKKFFPRFGLAWDPEGKGKMTIRAAYGMFGDRAMMYSGTISQIGPPWGNNFTVSGANVLNPWATFAGGNPLPYLTSHYAIGNPAHDIPFYPNGSYVTSPLSGFHPLYMNQWNLSIQRQVGDWLFSINYVGNNTIHEISGEQQDPAIFMGLGPCTLLTAKGPVHYSTCSTVSNQQNRTRLQQLNPVEGSYYASIGEVDDGGTAEYEGLFLSAQKQFSHGVTAQANYTYSHCIDDLENQSPGSVAPYNNRRQWRGNCDALDLRQQFVMNLVATTPRFSKPWVRRLASNWRIAPILVVKSATEFTVFAGTDRALTGIAGQTPDLVALNPYPASQSVDHWISRSAFSPAPLGSYGNLGYNNLKGPGVFQLNVALSREFPITEKRYIQLRGEAFNFPNHLNPYAPGNSATGQTNNAGAYVNLNSPNFGQITSDISGNSGLLAGDYRVVQLALKFVF